MGSMSVLVFIGACELGMNLVDSLVVNPASTQGVTELSENPAQKTVVFKSIRRPSLVSSTLWWVLLEVRLGLRNVNGF